MNHADTVPVLMYHHVSCAAGMITTSPANFEAQLRWLRRRGYRSLDSSQFADHLCNRVVAPRKSILITFDDGYLDNLVYAYPLLKTYGFSAMMFLVTGWVGNGPVRWRPGQNPLPETPAHDECERRIAQGLADQVILRWSEIQAMRADGVFEFHSHTHTHTRWDKSEQADQKNRLMAQELDMSRKALSRNLGDASEHFCWPQGYFDNDYVALAKRAGFRYLYTTRAFGRNRPGTDPALIHRFAVRNTSGASLERRIWVGSHPLVAPLFNRWKLWRRARTGRT